MPQQDQYGPTDVHPKERERVAQLIRSKKVEVALTVAKDIHKRCHTAASEKLLLDVYGARLESLIERKLDREATALMDMVRERYPAAGERLREWKALFAAGHGDLSALLEPLNDAALPAEKQAAIAAKVRRDVLDLRALAECQTLAAEHPLRAAASALHRAFEAVTMGPVADEALALPEVSRSSPLAGWKMLVRAIAAYYRRDDGLCEKFLAAVDKDSAAARLTPALSAMIHKAQTLTPASAALVKQAGESLDSLRAALKMLDAALGRRNPSLTLQEVFKAVAACRQVEPELLERLKQHIAVHVMTLGLNAGKVAAAMGGSSVKNAYFWRLLARAHEEDKGNSVAAGFACSSWEEFRNHAVREGWFPAEGPGAAAVDLHMVDVLQGFAPDVLRGLCRTFQRHFGGNADYFRGELAEIRALAPRGGNLDFLSVDHLLERACAADPCRENFERWLDYATQESPATCDAVAERWSAALPKDIPPVLRLMQSAEKRNAFQKAFRLMERAEKIDGLNAEVRRARLRLLVSMAARHLREKKPKLAEKELRQMEALPQAQQGDRPAFAAALRFVWCQLTGDKPGASSAVAEAERLLGNKNTAHLLLLAVEQWCGRRASALGDAPLPAVPLFAAFGRVCAVGDEMGMTVELIAGMPEQMMEELSAPNVSADPRVLEALGEAAMREDHFPFAYTVAGAGLTQGAESYARFLFLRARSLPPWKEERRSSCLAAASELARRQHDSELLRRIGKWRDEESEWLDVPDQAQAALDSEEIGRVVQGEIQEPTLSLSPPQIADDDEECQCPSCRAKRDELGDGLGDELPQELVEMMERLGPAATAKALAEMIGIGGKKKRGRRRTTYDGMDFPF